jgi:hypothetical protein
MQTLYCCADLDQAGEMDFERRFADGPVPTVGDWTWMNPDTQDCEWQVIATHLFRSTQSRSEQVVCLVEVAKEPIIESMLPDGIELYFLDGKFYTYCVSMGEKELVPDLGDFIEYEPGSNRTLPITKTVTHYETLTGDASCRIYVAYLQPVLVPVAA